MKDLNCAGEIGHRFGAIMRKFLPVHTPPTDGHRILEEPVPLRDSQLWALNARYFAQTGPSAWPSVPDYATTNHHNGRLQAELVFAYLQDLHATGALPPGTPVTCIEIGGGTGRFAFAFWRALKVLIAESRLGELDLRMVLTDLVADNLEPARTHPAWAEDVAAGHIYFRTWDVADPRPPVPVDGPLVVLANYVFDGVPADAFALADGELFGLNVGLTIPEEADAEAADLLEHLTVWWTPTPPLVDLMIAPLLEQYRAVGTGTFTVPTAGLAFLERVSDWSATSLVLVTDKGEHRIEDVVRSRLPDIALHGSFSMTVNLHAMLWWAEANGQTVLSAHHDGASVATVAMARGVDAVALRRTFRRQAPLDNSTFVTLRSMLRHVDVKTPREALALLRFTHHEPWSLRASVQVLQRALADRKILDADAAAVIARVEAASWNTGAYDLAHDIGLLWFVMNRHEDALRQFRQSIIKRPRASTWNNIARCHIALGQPEEAHAAAMRALHLDPDYEAARALLLALSPSEP